MFAELLSHSEEIIFLEAIDQNFESNSEFESNNDESNENLEEMNVKFCDKLEEEENISTENESYDSSSQKNNNNNQKYLIMKDYLNINKLYIDNFIIEMYNNYKSQVEHEKLKPYLKHKFYSISSLKDL